MQHSDILALILGGGAGTRLYPLTKMRAKPAVPFGGKYRLVDIPLSNCLNSGIRRIYVLTQYNSASLHHHIAQTYKFDVFSSGWVRILAAEQTPLSKDWYLGTADAVRKQLIQLKTETPRDFLILASDHLYRMDYADFVRAHREAQADITLAVQSVARFDTLRYGIVRLGADGRVWQLCEKPLDPTLLDRLATGPDPDRPYLASMGVYLFRTEVLYRLLETNPGLDFGEHILPAALRDYHVAAYRFDGYWEDVGTLRAFYEANLKLADSSFPLSFDDPERPIYAHSGFHLLPPSRVDKDCLLDRVLIAEGCQVIRSQIVHSVVGVRSFIGPDATLKRVVMMGAGYYESEADKAQSLRAGRPPIGIGRGCRIESAIIDKNARVGEGVMIRHWPDREPVETENYVVRDGLVVVTKNAVIPDGTVI